MKEKSNRVTVIAEAIQTIDEYYDYSFKIRNERCNPLISKLIQLLEEIFGYIDTMQKKEIQDILQNVIEAMSNKDYVKIRDLLYYDLKMILQKKYMQLTYL